MLLMAQSAKRMAPSDTENRASPSLISGGRMSMPICLQVRMYSDTLPELSMTEVISAAMNSTG